MVTRAWPLRSCLPAIVIIVVTWACTPEESSAFSFALVGDNPYGEAFVPPFESLITDVNAQRDLTWVLHVGDLKGSEPCSDSLLQSRYALLRRFKAPLVYTPGDNDWYDCREARMGSFDAPERLAFLRRLFFADSDRSTTGSTLVVERQSDAGAYGEFVENVAWMRGGVVFATVHLVRTDRPPNDTSVAERRQDAALTWIARTFRIATDRGARGVFIATQADPWFVSGLPVVIERILGCAQCLAPAPGLERLYPALVDAARSFDGPVVLAVGDTHIFRVDKPLYDAATGFLVENFTRVETFGDPYVHWVRVTVDPQTREVFSFSQQLVPANVRRGGAAMSNRR